MKCIGSRPAEHGLEARATMAKMAVPRIKMVCGVHRTGFGIWLGVVL